MPRTKDRVISIRTTSRIQGLIKKAADQNHRSIAGMIEVLVLDYAEEHGLKPASELRKSRLLKR